MKKVGVIVNPHAKKIRTGRVSIDSFEEYKSEFVDIRVTQTLDEVENILKEFKKQNIDYIGITGGDGSLHHVLTRMAKVYKNQDIPPIVILKGGTMDNVSRTINLKGTGFKILKRLTKAIEGNKEIKLHERDTMVIGDHICFLFGNGFVANFLNEVYQGEKGVIANIRVSLKALRHGLFEPAEGNLFGKIDGDIYLDGEKLSFDKTSALLAGTVESISTGISPLAIANSESGKFQVLISGLSGRQTLLRIYFLLGIIPKHKLLVNKMVKELKIESRESFEYTMDGDMYTCDNNITVKIGPKVKLVYI